VLLLLRYDDESMVKSLELVIKRRCRRVVLGYFRGCCAATELFMRMDGGLVARHGA